MTFCVMACAIYLPERSGEGKRRNLNLCYEGILDINSNEKARK